ncbi:MAG TPA: 4a-hydroxytetrahydrobiopterin dehydratase [Candidatus Poseidoniia archaeon]|nr:4a-hydroxytetrahydrobiopterin dehydratase [Candidatus Poseidoniia archaeon]|tara:strand:+ start:680 stop:979 length:300 start_codon:yes stop_codon:yes gene_type:complete
MDLLKDEDIANRIRMIGPWDYDSDDKILIRETMFKNFMEAMGFLNKLAEVAEKLDHHPDMTLCEYNRVIITTTTHDAGGITDNDIRLTQGFEEILESYD